MPHICRDTAALLAILGLPRVPLAAQETMNPAKVEIVDPTCAPGQCRCRGEIDSIGSLAQSGVDFRALRKGDQCLGADFNGDRVTDLVLTGGEGWVAVLLSKADGGQEAHLVDAGGVAELYPPRSEAGPHGEPVSDRYGILVRWVGQRHVIFIWDGARFTRSALPAW